MRVAFLASNAPRHNAIGNQTAERVRFFQERGAEVRVFLEDTRLLHPELAASASAAGEPNDAGPVWDYLSRCDLVFAVYARSFRLLQYLPRLAGTGPRIVFDYFGVTPPDLVHPQQRAEQEHSAKDRGFAWCADHALTMSRANRRELVDATQFPPPHVAVLPLPIDERWFHAGPRDRFLQEKLGGSGPVLLYVGRLAQNKRVPLLIEALRSLPAAQAVIIGARGDVYAEEAARCQSLAEELGLAGRVHFLGQLSDADLGRAYRSADVLVMPSEHEGFCVPIVEAQASGLPVIAARREALPETVGAAGLTFEPGDVGDLVRRLKRVLVKRPPRGAPPRFRVAVVSFRFGPDIVGGAETSLRGMGSALQEAGHDVEVFTTCTASESRWRNELPAGDCRLDGLTVHRFSIDAHDLIAHGDSVRAILDADGHVDRDLESRYLAHSIHSSALIDALKARSDFDAILAGPYLFGLTADIARAFADKTLLVPCFHDEPLARLSLWPTLYSEVAGILYHSPEEQHLAQADLGVNHPNAHVVGARVSLEATAPDRSLPRPYVVYCGRRSEQKNVRQLLDWARRYRHEREDGLDVVFLGAGEVELPAEPWLHDLGQVDEARKRAVLAGARALLQLSTQESLSLAVLEAWAEGTPVIVHRQCAVLAGQIERSGGGEAVADYPSFKAAIGDLQARPDVWDAQGRAGRAYVEAHYADARGYVQTLQGALQQMRLPIAEQMRERGLRRAAEHGRERWQQRFGALVEQILTQPARVRRDDLRIEPLRPDCRAAAGTRTVLLPVRLLNRGTHAAVPDGPGRTEIYCEVAGAESSTVRLPALLPPGRDQSAALTIPAPAEPGDYPLLLKVARPGAETLLAVELPMTVVAESTGGATCAATFLDAVQKSLPKTHALQQLPTGYVDVSTGVLAPAKRWVKRKLLHNFKSAYVDVLSRQQSQVNEQVVVMLHQLTECCAMLDHAVAGLCERMDQIEARMERLQSEPEALAKGSARGPHG